MSRSISTSACGISIGPAVSRSNDVPSSSIRARRAPPDPAFRSLSMGDLRQVPLQQLIKVGIRKVGDGGDAVAPQRRDFSHVQGALVDAQADIIGVELGEAVLPPLAARAFLVDDGPDQQLGVLVGPTGLLLRNGRDLDPECVLVVIALEEAAEPPTIRAAAGEGPHLRLGRDRPRPTPVLRRDHQSR